MKIAILGLGKVGVALAQYFILQGHQVLAIDDKKNRQELSAVAQALTAEFYLGGAAPYFTEVDACYISPGVSLEHPVAQKAKAAGHTLKGELDLAASLTTTPIIAITGTNGKSTTTSLMGHLLKCAGKNAPAGGNLGTPFIDMVQQNKNVDYWVVEVSSFQLEVTESFRPHVAIMLNFSDDHYDRHDGMEAYVKVKSRIAAYQTSKDYYIYNTDDLNVLKSLSYVKHAQKIPFSAVQTVTGVFEKDGNIIWNYSGQQAQFSLKEASLKGAHNLENMMATVACAKILGINNEAIAQGLKTFQGLPHRLELVATLGEVEFYDDSKGTNVGAVIMSLASFEGEVVLIAGGRDKGGAYAPLRALVKNKCKGLVLIGEAAQKINESLSGCTKIEFASSMQDAVKKAYQLCNGKGVVLLSPACSSFDMFRDYHHRGEEFKVSVKNLINTEDPASSATGGLLG